MAVETPGFANQNSSYGAEQLRRAFGSLLQRGATIGSITGGIVATGDMQLTAPGSGMSVNVATGEAWVPGSSSATQSGYYCRVSSTSNLSVAASDPTNPRVDRVSAVVTDSAYSGGTNTFAVSVVTGTPTSGANLTNLSGAAAAPASSLTLGYVLVPAGSTNVTGGNISNVAPLVSPIASASRGAVNIATSQSTSSTTFTTLGTPDQVTGVVMPTNGLIAVWYQATWQESVSGSARAAIFLGANEVTRDYIGGQVGVQVGLGAATASTNYALSTFGGGLATDTASAYTGDVTTGQVVGIGSNVSLKTLISPDGLGLTGNTGVGGPCFIFAAAGTYTVSIQFKVATGSVTASNRKMWVQALSFT